MEQENPEQKKHCQLTGYCPEGCENTTTMEEWVKTKGKEPDADIACSLSLTCSWYEDELKEQGRDDLAKNLATARQKSDGASPIEVCQELDKIKAQVEGPLRNRLFDFDCATQLYGVEC